MSSKVKTWLPKKQAFEIPTPEALPKLHGLFVLAGHRGAGKGVACVSLLRHYKRHGCADRVFWVSPTIGSNRAFLDELGVADADRLDTPDNAALDRVVQAVEAEAKEWEEHKRKLALWRRLHGGATMTIDQLLAAEDAGLLDLRDHASLQKPVAKYGHRPVLHLVVDDSLGTPLFSAGPRSKLVNLCVKHRHIGDGLGVSVWLLVQSWCAQGSVPRSIRENCTCAALWCCPQQAQRAKMAEELADRRGPEVFLQAYSQGTHEDHSFLVVDFTQKEGRYRKGWGGEILAQPT